MNTSEKQLDNQQESQKLCLEITQLKNSLQKEEFFHKTIYRQWNELNARMIAKERELKYLKSRNLLYKLTFYLVLFLLVPGYYLIGNGKKDERSASSSKAGFYSTATTNRALTKKPHTVQEPNLNKQKKEIIQQATTKPKVTNVKKEAVVEELRDLSDSIRYSVYWEGWTAYYAKSGNPYQKSTKQYEVWLKGWKKGEDEAKQLLAKSSFDTLNQLSGAVNIAKPLK